MTYSKIQFCKRNRIIYVISIFLVLNSLRVLGAPSSFVLDFEGLANDEAISGYYNGGLGASGSGPGVNYGVSFSSNSLAIIDSDAGGTGAIGGEPSPSTVLYFSTGLDVTMNFLSGFNTGFSFYYTSINFPGVVTVHSGLNGTGDTLATLNLPVTVSDGGGILMVTGALFLL